MNIIMPQNTEYWQTVAVIAVLITYDYQESYCVLYVVSFKRSTSKNIGQKLVI